jgi:hypothetical protein
MLLTGPGCRNADKVIEQGPSDAGNCTATLLAESTPCIGTDGAGHVDLTLSPCIDRGEFALEFDPTFEFALQVPERLTLSWAFVNPAPGGATVGFVLPAAADVRPHG